MGAETVGLKPSQCADCGMIVDHGEYHPYGACLMYKACHNSDQVRSNLAGIQQWTISEYGLKRPRKKGQPMTKPDERRCAYVLNGYPCNGLRADHGPIGMYGHTFFTAPTEAEQPRPCACEGAPTVSKADGLYCGVCGARIAAFVHQLTKASASSAPAGSGVSEDFDPRELARWQEDPPFGFHHLCGKDVPEVRRLSRALAAERQARLRLEGERDEPQSIRDLAVRALCRAIGIEWSKGILLDAPLTLAIRHNERVAVLEAAMAKVPHVEMECRGGFTKVIVDEHADYLGDLRRLECRENGGRCAALAMADAPAGVTRGTK